MKVILLSLFVALLMVGCGEGLLLEKLHLNGKHTEYYDDGQKKEEGNYKDGEKQGLWTTWYENGQKKAEINYKDGKLNGLSTDWYENGQERSEGNYKDGEANGLMTGWHPNGQKWKEISLKDGKPHGLETEWYENGQKKEESNKRDGKLMSAEVWKPNGEKCPVTNIDKDGNGVVVDYNMDGTEMFRYTYKDGKRVD